jgi:glycosyltransferase involved in cell wall biosynthesis
VKILQIIQFFNPSRGGSVIIPYNLSKELAKKGHNITILTTDFEFNKNFAQSIEKEGVQVIAFHCSLNISDFLITPSIIKWLRENIKKFDIVHMHNFRTFQNCIASHYAKKNGVPYILQPHGDIPIIIEKQKLKLLFDWVWGNRILNNASGVIAVLNYEVKQFHNFIPQNKISIIPNALDIDQFKNSPKFGEFKSKYRIEEKYLILYFGRINKRKGIEFLIKSFFQLNNERNDVFLVIAGHDEGCLKKLVELIQKLNLQNKVLILNIFIENISEIYKDADILVYPATYEIFGLVPFEALLCGTSVIVADDCGCGELVRKEDCGLLVKYGDILDLKEKIKYLIENPEIRMRLVQNGQKFILDNLTWDSTIKKFEITYENCIERSKKSIK